MGKEVKRCTIVSGAPQDDIAFINNHIDTSTLVIAADAGYLKLQQISIVPDVLIGDFDSSVLPDSLCKTVVLPVEKDATDTFAAVKYAVEQGSQDITILGAIGNRVDHTYSNILCLDYCRKRGVTCRLMNQNNRISLITERAVINKDYRWFSLFAFLEECKGVSIEGAYYTAGFYDKERLDFHPGDQFGQSNYVKDDFATVTVQEGTLLLIESNDF